MAGGASRCMVVRVVIAMGYKNHPIFYQLAIIHEVDNSTRNKLKCIQTVVKSESVRAAAIIFANGKFIHQLKFKLHGHCSNNQAEQIAILKVLEKLEELKDGQHNDKRVAVYTDSKVTLDLFLISNFRRVLNLVYVLLGISPASD
jgi:hypothetical protein